MLASYAPKVYNHYQETMKALFERDSTLVANFANSVYPTATFNLGPSSVCRDHNDSTNLPQGFCTVTALGDFNPDEGGFFYLWDLKTFFRFPPGSTILIPSSSLRHGNTPIGPSERRYSFTQYCPGALMRWVRLRFRQAQTVSNSERPRLEGTAEEKWLEAIKMLSTHSQLCKDREMYLQ